MAEKMLKLGLQRDYNKFLYFIDGDGNVCRHDKDGTNPVIIQPKAVIRDNDYLYFVDKDGDVSRVERQHRTRKPA